MTHLKKGDIAPAIKGIDQHGKSVSLNDYKGKKVVLYFYPKDSTPGCTAEACNLRDNYQELLKSGFEVMGVSPDNEESHQKFITKYNLPFSLLADTSKKIAKDYGVWGEKKMYGKSYDGILRTTFVISENGKIEKIIDKVKTDEHANQILNEHK